MSIQSVQWDPDLGRNVNKNLVPSLIQSRYGPDRTLAYHFEKALAPLGKLLNNDLPTEVLPETLGEV